MAVTVFGYSSRSWADCPRVEVMAVNITGGWRKGTGKVVRSEIVLDLMIIIPFKNLRMPSPPPRQL